MSSNWNPRKIITNLSREEFKEWCIENRNNLKDYIDSLADDPAQYNAFEQFILTEYDLRTWNNLIDSLGEPTCKHPSASLKYRDLVGKPNLNGAIIQDNMVLENGLGIEIEGPTVTTDESTGLKTTKLKISSNGATGGYWGGIQGTLSDQTDLQAALDAKQSKVIYQEEEPTEAVEGDLWAFKSDEESISYDDLSDKPSINLVELQGDISLSQLDLYSQEEVNKLVATASGQFRGRFEAGTTEPLGFDYDTYIKEQPEIQAITPGNNDFCYVVWTDDKKVYTCIYVSSTSTWEPNGFHYERDTEQVVELYGAKGSVTEEQLAKLKDSTSNYIWWGEDTAADDGILLHCSYYNPTVNATYEKVLGNTNYKLNLDLDTKQWSLTEINLGALAMYPVGSIYININNTDPSTYFGGTWEQIKDTFLLSAGDTYTAGSTGGSADSVVVSHTHTMEEAGVHSHNVDFGSTGTEARGVTFINRTSGQYGTVLNSGGHTHTINSTGESGTGKNMPPYLTVYMWKRIA